MPIIAARLRGPAVALLLAFAVAQCGRSPESPTGPSPVLSRGAVPQSGGPPPAGDSLGTVTALGATRFMAYGDSITFGTVSSFDGGYLFDSIPGTEYPVQFDNQLESAFASQNFTVTNEGVPGEWALQAITNGRFAQRMAAQRPQALLLLEGINDLNNDQSVAATVGYLQQMVELARLYNTTVFIGTMFQTCVSTSPSGQVRPNAATRINGFNSALRAMAAGRQNVHVVDLFAAFGTQNCGPDGGIGILGGDGLHPNPSGYSIIATQFAAAVRNVFAVRGSYQ
jgi:lysophospholipase L1-like esterase